MNYIIIVSIIMSLATIVECYGIKKNDGTNGDAGISFIAGAILCLCIGIGCFMLRKDKADSERASSTQIEQTTNSTQP